MSFITNVVIGKPLVCPSFLFASSHEDWNSLEKAQTLFTNERFLPRILVQCGLFSSTSEVKRTHDHLWITLRHLDFFPLIFGRKHRQLWICVGEYSDHAYTM